MTRRPRTLLIAAAICAGLFLVLLLLAYASPAARRLDADALQGFVDIPEGGGTTLGQKVVSFGNVGWVALFATWFALVALLRNRPRVAIAVLALVAATSVSSQVLKAVFAYPRAAGEIVLGPEAFPSGHSTAAMTLALCAVLVAPAMLRPLVALFGGAYALAMGFALISTGAHFPSDVVAGYLLATGWTFVTVAALLALDTREPRRVEPATRTVAERIPAVGAFAVAVGAAVVVTAAAAVLLATRHGDLAEFARDHTAVVLVGPAVASAAGLLLAAVTAMLRRGD